MRTLPDGPHNTLLVNWQSFRDPMGSAERWRKKYGDPMTYPLIEGQPSLVTGSPDGIRALFGAPPDAIDPALVDRISALLGDSSLLALNGSKHTAMRKLLMPPFHGQRMRVYGKQICDLTAEQTRGFSPGTPFIAQELMHRITLQVIIQLVFGVTAPEKVAQVVKLLDAHRRAIPGAVLPILVPCLRREFWGFGPWARFQRAVRNLRETLGQEIKNRRADSAEHTDILSLLVAARHEDGTGMSDQQIFEQLITLLMAGHSSTATALSWALCFLTQHREVLTRVRAELKSFGENPEPEVIAKAPFLEAVCHETLRLRPAVGALGRKLKAPLEIAGYKMPAGSYVFAHILWAHSNPNVFAQPERFLPERFLERTFTPFEFLPFGGGSRRCIGAAFALYEMKLILATLIRRHDFELATKKPIRVTTREVLCPSRPISIIVRPIST